MEKVVLLMPNTHSEVKLNLKKDPPIGILYIASVLRNAGYDLHVVDAFALNISLDEAVKRVLDLEPNYLGISCNYSPLHNITLKIADEIKAINSSINIFVGGNHATACANELLVQSNNSIDAICLGQGEKSVLAYLNAKKELLDFSTVCGVAYVSGNEIVINEKCSIIEDLDSIPFPAYDLIDMDIYDRYNIIASRGCPFACTYCASNVIVQKFVKYRSAQNILDEVEMLIAEYGEKMFWFSDDTFTANQKFANALMDEIAYRKVQFKWSCLTRVNKTSLKLLEKMKSNGCQYISYGVESGNDQILANMNKMIEKSEIKSAIELTKKANIDVYTFFLIGYPGENTQTIEDTFKLVHEINPTGASFAIVIPLPGTTMWNQLVSTQKIFFDEIEWDYLFATTGRESESERYSAKLASKWCNISEDELIKFYEIGNQIIKDE